MLIGEVVQRPDQSISIKALKLSDLSSNQALQKMWHLEVKDAKALYQQN